MFYVLWFPRLSQVICSSLFIYISTTQTLYPHRLYHPSITMNLQILETEDLEILLLLLSENKNLTRDITMLTASNKRLQLLFQTVEEENKRLMSEGVALNDDKVELKKQLEGVGKEWKVLMEDKAILQKHKDDLNLFVLHFEIKSKGRLENLKETDKVELMKLIEAELFNGSSVMVNNYVQLRLESISKEKKNLKRQLGTRQASQHHGQHKDKEQNEVLNILLALPLFVMAWIVVKVALACVETIVEF